MEAPSSRPEMPPRPSDEDWIAMFRQIRRARRDPWTGWLMLIKELRVTHQCSILEAERIVVSNAHMRRYVERAINAGNPSRKRALAHIRYNGSASLIVRADDSFDFSIPPP
ncbi:hypothetical protein [Aurantiacibacter poecillastricola]|uniref:hypothetical protein n=1 Tax=Aurantiacibacter poecillastricola TaxID=3064385 RepID=UPI00273D83CD|nr:hypothetical protein [Aurantiacibacter sp. 219JJ12-13]MDP5262612.1 hypothetical protein [Aurantiacibacter sp. 219JJ12-13]